VTDFEDVVHLVTAWATSRPDVTGLLLVGSYARGAARPDSDVDLVVLMSIPDPSCADELELGTLIRTETWGPIQERRFRTPTGLEVECGIGPSSWAATNPIDPGTHRVITDGARILHDPKGILDELVKACSSPAK
jgi:Nucleotidyltransferase domain